MDMISLIEKALNIRSQYHRVISGNIVNSQTPGYKEKDVDFRREFDKNISTDMVGLGGGEVEVREVSTGDSLPGLDGNTVNLEDQMVKLTENQLMFHSLVQVAAKRFSLMKYVIREGK